MPGKRMMDFSNCYPEDPHSLNFGAQRGFLKVLKSGLKETLFPDDPFREIKKEDKPLFKAIKWLQYLVPIFQWLPTYTWKLFISDFFAGLTATSIAVPQAISYAKLAGLHPIIGLYTCFVPPIVYAIFGSSRHLSVGPIASASLLISQTISTVVRPEDDPVLYLHLVLTTTFVAGLFQACLGVLRLGILVDLLSHSTITGFMGGAAVMLTLQQLKGMFGLKHFAHKTGVITVLQSIWTYRHEIRWETTVMGLIFLAYLQITKHQRNRNRKLFWLSAMAPMTTVIVGGVFTYLVNGKRHGIQTVGHLSRGINPLSIKALKFDSTYLAPVLRAGFITGVLSMAEGIAIGRSFAVVENTPHDGNKEMIAFGLMNMCGSITSCYLTTGPFSKTAVNYIAGCKTAMSNLVQAFLVAFTLEFLAPLFGYTPLVVLSAIIISAVLGFLNYAEVVRLYKVDKFDFVICMAGFFGVIFIALDVGLMISVGLSILRALLYVARPDSCKLGKLPELGLYRDAEQYTVSTLPGILIVQLGSPMYFANSNYVKERIMRYIRCEEDSTGVTVEQIILDLSGVTSIDTTSLEGLWETNKIIENNGIQLKFVNPRIEVVEKMMAAKFVSRIGKESFFLTLEDAVKASQIALRKSRASNSEDGMIKGTTIHQSAVDSC
ncbi:hypothetical protein PIB30_006505 [Stylosanthes scabra]|uniref:STAS domain-containing protein n=1 Tax=Stylosanthes scabra TaxID=79078 RepID=A0ABU6V2L8_9FABA|nr:hypothetical protein [Stylosanthes scabra]